MSDGRHLPIQSLLWSVVLVAVATGSVYLAYELVIVPRRALQDQIREQKDTIEAWSRGRALDRDLLAAGGFPSPLIEPDMRISRIRLSDHLRPAACTRNPSR